MIANWNVPFYMTSASYGGGVLLPFNETFAFPAGTGKIVLKQEGCSLAAAVRSTKDNVPQADGSILHRRFLTGMEMQLSAWFWETTGAEGKMACDDLLQSMVDTFMGYAYGLLNAGDNEGRISWLPDGAAPRMLDDIRLASYPKEAHVDGPGMGFEFMIDCALPYAENLEQLAPAVPGVVVNGGNRPTYPVWQIDGPFSGVMTLANTTTGEEFSYDEDLPEAPNIDAGDYLEIDVFRNSATKIAPGPVLSNAFPGLVLPDSAFFEIVPGNNTITLSGAPSGNGLINAAWQS